MNEENNTLNIDRDKPIQAIKVHSYYAVDGQHFRYYCPVCHKLLQEEDNFCSICGQRLEKEPAAE